MSMKILRNIVRFYFGTLGVGLVIFGTYRGISESKKLWLVPAGLVLIAIVWWASTRPKSG